LETIEVVYESRKYVFEPDSGWVDDQNDSVPKIMETFLSRRAVANGANADIFGGEKTLDEKAKVTKVQRKAKKPKKTKKKFSINLGGE
jgi:sulfatase maturation enzyme AslB (radical SAM superfamily)